MIKFFCDIEGLQDNWIGMSERWTQGETKLAEAAMGQGWTDYLAFLAKKVESCNLLVGEMILSNFTEVTEESLDAMDLRLVGFIGGMISQTTIRLRSLGNASARVSSSMNVGKN